MNKYFIHKSSLRRLTELAQGGGGYKKVEILVVKRDFELVEPDPEVRKQWIQIKFMVYGGG